MADFRGLGIGPQTILFGDGEVPIPHSLVHCIRMITGKLGKRAVFEVQWQGITAIAKCWCKEDRHLYVNLSLLSSPQTPSSCALSVSDVGIQQAVLVGRWMLIMDAAVHCSWL
jgi:hypothetical protein